MGKANATEDLKRDAVFQISDQGHPVTQMAGGSGSNPGLY